MLSCIESKNQSNLREGSSDDSGSVNKPATDDKTAEFKTDKDEPIKKSKHDIAINSQKDRHFPLAEKVLIFSPQAVFQTLLTVLPNGVLQYDYFSTGDEKTYKVLYTFDRTTQSWIAEENESTEEYSILKPDSLLTEKITLQDSGEEFSCYTAHFDYNEDGINDKVCLSESEFVSELKSWGSIGKYSTNDLVKRKDDLALRILIVDGKSGTTLRNTVIEANYHDDITPDDPRIVNAFGILMIEVKGKDYIMAFFNGPSYACCCPYFYRLYTLDDLTLAFESVYDVYGELPDSYMYYQNYRKPMYGDFNNDGISEVILFNDGVGRNSFKLITFVDG